MNPIYIPAKDLDPVQRDIYDLKADARFIVKGCAGSGKTSLALLRMKAALENDKDSPITSFYYVTFVRELVECMRKELRQMPDASSPYSDYSITLEDWKRGYITGWTAKTFDIRTRPGQQLISGNNPYASRDIRVNKRPDYLFVDECQDLEMDDIRSLMTGAQKGVGFYGDDGQHIMSWPGRHPVTLEDIQEALGIKIYPLVFNYRLPKPIALFAEQIGGQPDLARHCKKNPYTEKPFLIKVVDDNEAINYIKSRIGKGLQDVGIAFATNEQVKKAYNTLATYLGGSKISASWNIRSPEGSPRTNDYSYLSDTPVKVMTYEKIKGRQFETVFLFASGEMDSEMARRFYVGATRSERFLYVLYTEPMPSLLRQVPLGLYSDTDELADFNDLFDRSRSTAQSNSNTETPVAVDTTPIDIPW